MNQITLNRRALLGIVEMAIRVQGKPKKGEELPPLLRCVCIEWGTYESGGIFADARATTGKAWYEAKLYPAEDAILGAGSVAINAADLREILRSSKAVDVTIRHLGERQTVELEIGDATVTLPGFDGYRFPYAPTARFCGADTLLELPMPQLRRLCAQASYPIAADAPPSLAALVGVREDSIVLSATDGHRLALGRLRLWSSASRRRDVLIPAPALRLISTVKAECRAVVSHLDSIGPDPALTLVEIGKRQKVVIQSPTLGTFPGVEDLLARQRRAATVVVDREALIGAVSRAAVIATQIKLSLVSTSLEIDSCALDPAYSGHVRERLLAEIHRDETGPVAATGAALNSDYLLETLAVVDTDRVVLTFGWPDEPVHVAPFGTGCSSEAQEHLIMPIRIDEQSAAGNHEPMPIVTSEQLAEAMRERPANFDGLESVTVQVGDEEPVEVFRADPQPEEPEEDETEEIAAEPQIEPDEEPEEQEAVDPVADDDCAVDAESAYPVNPRRADDPEPIKFIAEDGTVVTAGWWLIAGKRVGTQFDVVIRERDGALYALTEAGLERERNGETSSPGVAIEELDKTHRFVARRDDEKAAA